MRVVTVMRMVRVMARGSGDRVVIWQRQQGRLRCFSNGAGTLRDRSLRSTDAEPRVGSCSGCSLGKDGGQRYSKRYQYRLPFHLAATLSVPIEKCQALKVFLNQTRNLRHDSQSPKSPRRSSGTSSTYER